MLKCVSSHLRFYSYFFPMNKIFLSGIVLISAAPLLSFATEIGSSHVFTNTEISYIQWVNCDSFSGSSHDYCISLKTKVSAQLSNTGIGLTSSSSIWTQSGKTWSGSEYPKYPHHDENHGTWNTWSGTTTPHTPSGSGNINIGNISEAIAKLSSTDRDTLVKIIHDYLTSKGITISDVKTIKQDIKDTRQEVKWEIKDTRAAVHQVIKDTRETLKKDIQGKRDILKEALQKKRDAIKEKYSVGVNVSGTVSQ